MHMYSSLCDRSFLQTYIGLRQPRRRSYTESCSENLITPATRQCIGDSPVRRTRTGIRPLQAAREIILIRSAKGPGTRNYTSILDVLGYIGMFYYLPLKEM